MSAAESVRRPAPAGPLHVVRRGRRHVPQHHRLQFADVHAQLERGRAGQGVDLAADEALLDVRGLVLVSWPVCSLRPERHRIERPVQVPVMVIVLPGGGDDVFLQHPAAADGRADIPDRYRGQAAALPAVVHHIVRADRGRASARCDPPGGQRRAVRRWVVASHPSRWPFRNRQHPWSTSRGSAGLPVAFSTRVT